MRRVGATLLGAALAIVRCSSDSAPTDAVPPGPPDAPVYQPVNTETFAIDSVLLGDSADAGWATLGYDLDGLFTDAGDTNVCWLFQGAAQGTQQDGVLGRDNAWGAAVVPTLMPLLSTTTLTADQNAALGAGKWTIQIQVKGLDDTPTQTSTGVTMQFFASDDFGGKPAFDSTTDWPVSSDSLNTPSDITAGSVAYVSDGYITNGTVVGRADPKVVMPLHLSVRGVPLRLRLHAPLVAFDHKTAPEITNGVLTGTLDPDELQAAVDGTLNSLSCNGAPPDTDAFRQAMDILADRTNAPNTACTAISFGIAFHGKRVANPTKVAPPPGVVDPCADAGAD